MHKLVKIYTSKGLIALESLGHGTTVDLLTKDGNYRGATIKKGTKATEVFYDVLFYRASSKQLRILTDQNHLWYLQENCVTETLEPDDKVLGFFDMGNPDPARKVLWRTRSTTSTTTRDYSWSVRGVDSFVIENGIIIGVL